MTRFHLQRWIKEACEKYQPKKKLDSPRFLEQVKHDLRITSRKITRFVTKKSIQLEPEVLASACAFVQSMNEKAAEEELPDSAFWNADQSRFEYEMIRNRTLAKKGEKIVESRVVSPNAVSHSYTIQVHLSKSGQLGSKIFIVFKELANQFGPRVQEEVNSVLQICPNIAVTATTSGKFTTKVMQDWFSDVFAEDLQPRTVLLLDAWTGQGSNAQLETLVENVEIAYLPKLSTRYIQPLDVYFFRQYKILARNITEVCRDSHFSDNSVAKPENRYFIMKLQCICFNQVSHPRFTRMWRYAWQKPGYDLEERVEEFECLNQILINPTRARDAKCDEHDDFPIIKCVYCDKFLCFTCMFEPVHYHHI